MKKFIFLMMIILCSDLWASMYDQESKFVMSKGYCEKATEALYRIVIGSDDSPEAVQAVKEAISAGADPYVEQDLSRLKSLHLAVKHNLIHVVAALLECGVPVDLRNSYEEEIPLHVAARSDTTKEIAKFLIESGANVNNKSLLGNSPTALHLAVLHGAVEIVELLLQYGAIVEENISLTHRSWHPSPLDLFICPQLDTLWRQRNRSPKIVRLLMENGATMPYRMTKEQIDYFDSIIENINNENIEQ